MSWWDASASSWNPRNNYSWAFKWTVCWVFQQCISKLMFCLLFLGCGQWNPWPRSYILQHGPIQWHQPWGFQDFSRGVDKLSLLVVAAEPLQTWLGVSWVFSKIPFPLAGWCRVGCARQPCGEGGGSDWLESWKLGIRLIFKIPKSQGSACCVKLGSFYGVNFWV